MTLPLTRQLPSLHVLSSENIRVCVCVCVCVCVVSYVRPTLRPCPGILQARILEWVAIPARLQSHLLLHSFLYNLCKFNLAQHTKNSPPN